MQSFEKQTDTIQEIQRLFADRLFRPVGDPNLDLFESGILDSMALIELLLELEKKFDCQISIMELDVEQIRTVRKIATMVEAVKV